jgi:hypothetical protein
MLRLVSVNLRIAFQVNPSLTWTEAKSICHHKRREEKSTFHKSQCISNGTPLWYRSRDQVWSFVTTWTFDLYQKRTTEILTTSHRHLNAFWIDMFVQKKVFSNGNYYIAIAEPPSTWKWLTRCRIADSTEDKPARSEYIGPSFPLSKCSVIFTFHQCLCLP